MLTLSRQGPLAISLCFPSLFSLSIPRTIISFPTPITVVGRAKTNREVPPHCDISITVPPPPISLHLHTAHVSLSRAPSPVLLSRSVGRSLFLLCCWLFSYRSSIRPLLPDAIFSMTICTLRNHLLLIHLCLRGFFLIFKEPFPLAAQF